MTATNSEVKKAIQAIKKLWKNRSYLSRGQDYPSTYREKGYRCGRDYLKAAFDEFKFSLRLYIRTYLFKSFYGSSHLLHRKCLNS